MIYRVASAMNLNFGALRVVIASNEVLNSIGKREIKEEIASDVVRQSSFDRILGVKEDSEAIGHKTKGNHKTPKLSS